MDTVSLPILSSDDSLDTAKSAMRSADRAAVIRKHAEVYALVFVGRVLDAIRRGAKTLGEVRDATPVHVSDATLARHYSFDLTDPRNTRQESEAFLDSMGASYSIVVQDPGRALLMTRHERQTGLINKYSSYECTGSTTHSFPTPEVQVGDLCPMCLGAKGTIRQI